VKGDRPAGKFYCPYCLSNGEVWDKKTKRVLCASCGGVIGWYGSRRNKH